MKLKELIEVSSGHDWMWIWEDERWIASYDGRNAIPAALGEREVRQIRISPLTLNGFDVFLS